LSGVAFFSRLVEKLQFLHCVPTDVSHPDALGSTFVRGAMRPSEQDRSDRKRDALYKLRSEPNAVRRFAVRKMFNLLQSAGLHVTADHFYEPIPNTVEVASKYDDGPRSCLGIDFKEPQAIAEWIRIVQLYGREFLEATRSFGYYPDNAYFRGVDALTLYCVLRDVKPKRVIEVGQGFSTRVSLAALSENGKESGVVPSMTSIDPYARFLKEVPAVNFQVIEKPLQESLEFLSGLNAGDMLFVDSSHVHKFGSDVEIFFDEVYPKIPAGVLIHIHDIFSPYNYPLHWFVSAKRFWNEQYHLENFLRFNKHFEVFVPLHLIMRKSPDAVASARAIFGGGDHLYLGQSIYLRTV
jgi:hypothetical protein